MLIADALDSGYTCTPICWPCHFGSVTTWTKQDAGTMAIASVLLTYTTPGACLAD